MDGKGQRRTVPSRSKGQLRELIYFKIIGALIHVQL
jgi:hypothetical protein